MVQSRGDISYQVQFISSGISSPAVQIMCSLFRGRTLVFARSSGQKLHFTSKSLDEWRDIGRQTLRRNLYKLEQGGWVRRTRYGGEVHFVLSEKGCMHARKICNTMRSKSEKPKWDKQWRIIIFDIPESDRNKRDTLRAVIKSFGFIKIQQSVWAHKYDYYNEIDDIAKLLKIDKYLSYIVADHESQKKLIKKHFAAYKFQTKESKNNER